MENYQEERYRFLEAGLQMRFALFTLRQSPLPEGDQTGA